MHVKYILTIYHCTSLESSRSRKLKYAVSAGLAKRRKNYSSFKFLLENLEKFRSTKLYYGPLEGSTIFLYCSSLGRTSMESCRLAELKYAIFSGTGRKTKKLQCSKLFLSMFSKHGLLEGSTFLFSYSSITRTLSESSRLGELKYAISSRTGHKTKKLRHSNLFLSTVFKHGLLKGSTFLS